MVNIIKQEVVIEESLKKKLKLICEFSNTTLKIINGSIRKIENNNQIREITEENRNGFDLIEKAEKEIKYMEGHKKRLQNKLLVIV